MQSDWRRFRCAEPDFDEEFVNVFAFAGPFGGAFAVNRIVGEQDSVALEMRTASGGVCDDRIHLPQVEAVEVTPGELGFALRPLFSAVRA